MLTRDASGADSRVTGHPGMAPYYTIVEVQDGRIASIRHIKNEMAEKELEEHRAGGHEHGHGHRNSFFMKVMEEERPDAVITYTIGPGAAFVLGSMGIKAYYPKGHTVKENVEALLRGELQAIWS